MTPTSKPLPDLPDALANPNNNGYFQVQNIKLATMLASFGVPLVSPTVTKVLVKNRRTNKIESVIAYFFGYTSVGGLNAMKLVEAWEHPDRYTDLSRDNPYCFVPMMRAILDNNDVWRNATLELRAVVEKHAYGNPSPEECNRQLVLAARTIVPHIKMVKGRSYAVVRQDASKDHQREILEQLNKVAK